MLDCLPLRWADQVRRRSLADRPSVLSAVNDLTSARVSVPISSGGRVTSYWAIKNEAKDRAAECYGLVSGVSSDLAVAAIRGVCEVAGVRVPIAGDSAGYIARAVSVDWWCSKLRRKWLREFEHVAIRVGVTTARHDPYVSRETAQIIRARNLKNAQILQKTEAINEHGQVYSLGDLADLGTANKAIRRGELMLRIRGCEEIAVEHGHVGVFVTLTCPSKYHAVGASNDKYSGASPRDAQAYLCKVWSRLRSHLARVECVPYGFRIAEPHTDGCPHWHLLLFVDAAKAGALEAGFGRYGLAEDGDEKGAEKNRVKIVRIEAGKGTAAGYIAKYVAKSIDGCGVGQHKGSEGGRNFDVVDDLLGDAEITPSERVTAWAQCWGIRQFQQIGGPPVGVWRELRRIDPLTVQTAPKIIIDAVAAVNRIGAGDSVAKPADWAAYWRLQGVGGRGGNLVLVRQFVETEGRYGASERLCPVGVALSVAPMAVYESVRYRWTMKRAEGVSGVEFDLPPWTGVNNCTEGTETEYQNSDFISTFTHKEKIDNAKKLHESRMVLVPHYARKKHLEQLVKKYAEKGYKKCQKTGFLIRDGGVANRN